MRQGLRAVVAAMALGLPACAKVEVVRVPKDAAKTSGDGVFYALPRTVPRVLVKVDQKVSQSAPFARFAPIFAPGSTPPCGTISHCKTIGTKKVTKYSLQDGATFSTFGEPNPDEVYMVKFTGGGAVDQALEMTWNEAGLLSKASAQVTNRVADIVVSGVKLATGLGTSFAAGSVAAEDQTKETDDNVPTNERCAKNNHTANDMWVIPILRRVEGDILKNALVANYCELPAKAPDANTKVDSRDNYDEKDRPLLERAVRAYELRLKEMVNQRHTQLTAPSLAILEPDKYLERIERAINEQMTALFLGSVSTTTWDLPFELRELVPTKPVRILGLHATDGVCPDQTLLAPDAKPAPSDMAVLPADKCDNNVRVSINYHPAQDTQLFSRVKAGVSDGTGDRSFRYVLPAQVKGEVKIAERTYGTGVFAMAQLGHVVSLPAKRNSKALSYELSLIEATGGLKGFKLGSTGGLDAATIDALAGTATTAIDARTGRRKADETEAKAAAAAAATAADELTTLTRQHDLLKLKDAICELQKKYGLACTIQP